MENVPAQQEQVPHKDRWVSSGLVQHILLVCNDTVMACSTQCLEMGGTRMSQICLR